MDHAGTHALPRPLEPEATVQVGFLLRPEQVAWIKAHARRNASLFMRQLLDQQMEQERREVQRLLEARHQRQQEPAEVPTGQI
ncbi:hypothetical protein KBY96_14195 [Cyanobium sp. ATX 6A2]|uniref:hypothetical protein n=1 Tax=Cyanobium sp. ATX 6A2 TaxID=2823700 RepID=UPI0020CD9201|nr:hypothetical protein [Cyanobium sp. ATX 6A2]MCP9889074.1 hypothetical protein [Cyanobium sp. ATX 6A2]